MIEGLGPVTQALLGTLLTWGLTALGAGMVIFLRGNQRKSLDASLGFAAGGEHKLQTKYNWFLIQISF